MELYAAVRRSVYVEGLSERAAARRFGLARETVRKMLRYRLPPGYRRAQPIRRPKLDAFTGVIDQILREDQSRPKKQRHTAKRIGERLRAEYGFTGGDTIVKAYVRAQRLGGQEMFVPLAHPPGDAQADFGEALVVIAGVECKAHYLVVDLPHSDDGFVKAFPAETTEAFCDGHNAAFTYFGGVPRRIVYDNTKLAVARILGDGTRQRTQVFSELQSHYLFDARFGRPGKGNDKGKVEGLVGYARRNFFVPIPRVGSWDASFGFSIDPATVINRTVLNDLWVATYRGAASNHLFTEVQMSQKRHGFRDNGGLSAAIGDSPFITLTQQLAHFNAPYFDASDPQDRDNQQLTGSAIYYLDTQTIGTHSLKAGFEQFRSTLRGGGSQSATGFVFDADYGVGPGGEPLLDVDGSLSQAQS